MKPEQDPNTQSAPPQAPPPHKNERRGFSVPIRVKIIGIVALALLVSIVSFITVGRHLMIEDKTSYIFDFNLSRVQFAGNQIESRIKRSFEGGRTLLASLTPGTSLLSLSLSTLQQGWLGQLETELKLPGFLLLAPKGSLPGALPLQSTAETPWEVIASLHSKSNELSGTPGAQDPVRKSLEDGFSKLKLSLDWAKGEPAQVIPLLHTDDGSSPQGTRSLALLLRLGNENQFQLLYTQIKLNDDFFDATKESRDMELRLITPDGMTAARSSEQPSVLTQQELANLATQIATSRFPSGVRDWKGKSDLMVGYRKVQGTSLILLSLIPRDLAFAPAQALSNRTLLLGLSILFLSIGATLIFIRGMITRLKELWSATQKVAEGDFKVRVEASQKRGDELEDLATSFNTMADKIDVLIKATADKARMEKELETAQMLQSLFFPSHGLECENFRLQGKFMPASECAGDWWQFAKSPDGRYVLVVVGDVTGHGVSAALVTAAIHGGFTLAVHQLPYAKGPNAVITQLLQELNSVVLHAAGGNATMTFIATLLDLETGQFTIANAGHLAPLLYRPSATSPSVKDFKSLVVKQGAALGAAPTIEVFPQAFYLSANDRIFWYTDGLIEGPSAGRLSKTKFLKQIFEVYSRYAEFSEKICEDIIQTCYSDPHLLASQMERPDDITVMIAAVPASAPWKLKDAESQGTDAKPSGQAA